MGPEMERRQKINPRFLTNPPRPKIGSATIRPKDKIRLPELPARAEGQSHAKTYVGYRRLRGPALLTRAGPLRIRAVRCRVHERVWNAEDVNTAHPARESLTLA